MPLGDTRCRACRTHEETVMHLLSACPQYAPTLYTDRHNMALKVLYYHLRHEYKIDEQSIAQYQVRDPEAVITNDRCKLYWNFSFSTTTQLPHNNPDLMILDSLEKKMYVTAMSCPADTNIADKEDENIRKYKDLMYNFKNIYKKYETIFIPIIVGVMGRMKSNIVVYL
ncbi:hypothetical protein Trydic_g20567 [Trypoxylus dichotomus]